ncbi:MAG: murein biosynthesis integral membrane protein MurJ, partial [bacterium]|nr:murein biosynthesis integral membrane protein MurJ [bacterium]
LPDLIFEVLVFGTFSAAFIPVFTKALKKGKKEAWILAGTVANIGLLVFLVLAVVVIIFANHFYGFLAPGFGADNRDQIVLMSRILFAAQGFFVISYVLTAVLESSRRFLVPAIAPLFYNTGIILGTLFLSRPLGLLGPVIGVIVGSACHFLIQLPFALKLGFRFSLKIKIDDEVKKVGKLALPRIIEVSFLQIAKTTELYLASIISAASYTYFTFGNSLQLLPVGLFGTSIAKAALPTLSRQADLPEEFKKTLFNALYQVSFLILPVSAVLLVLRIPLVRLIFGTDIFSWEATVQTGMVVSAFGVGIVFQTLAALLARGFYALHDTKTPVTISVLTITLNIIADFILIKHFGLPAWGLAIAFSFSSFIQTLALFVFLKKKLSFRFNLGVIMPLIKAAIASTVSGGVMYFLLKIFDKSVWVKKLSFLGKLDVGKNIPFEKFVLDTRLTFNLLVLTIFVIVVGIIVYYLASLILRSGELKYFSGLVKRILKAKTVGPISQVESELTIDNN